MPQRAIIQYVQILRYSMILLSFRELQYTIYRLGLHFLLPAPFQLNISLSPLLNKTFCQINTAVWGNSNLKKIITWKKVTIVVAVLVVISVPLCYRHIKNSRNEAAQTMLRQIALAEMATQTTSCFSWSCNNYLFTDGVSTTAEETVMELAVFGFRPDVSIAFHVMHPGVVDGVALDSSKGFIAFTAHNSVGSTVYVYDSIAGGGVQEARENGVYSGVSVNDARNSLFRYEYDSSNTAAPVAKKSNAVKFAPDPDDTYPARLIVTVAAE